MSRVVSIPPRPLFLEKLRHCQHAQLARCVALSGNIYDLFPIKEGDATQFVALETLLLKALRNPRDLRSKDDKRLDPFIIVALRSDGIHFVSPEDKKHLLRIFEEAPRMIEVQAKQDFGNEREKEARQELTKDIASLKTLFQKLERRDVTPLVAVQMIAGFLREVGHIRELLAETKVFVQGDREHYIRPVCVIIEQANLVLPNLSVDRMTQQDREFWKVMHELLLDESIWPTDETADLRSDFIILLSPTVAELNPALFNLPKTIPLDIPPADELSRKTRARIKLQRFPIPHLYGHDDGELEVAISEFARDTGGLTLSIIDDLLTAAHRDPAFTLDRRSITEVVNQKLEIALGQTIKLVRPEHTEKDLRGGRKLWPELEYLADWADDPKRAPYGIIVPGPNDAGKTYTFEAWSVYTGRTVLEIAGGMRNPYYGQTDIFAERFEYYCSSYNKICVLVDEAHKAFGSIHQSDTYQAEANLARQIIKMSGNPKYRSKIFWVFITTRPDMLDPDFRRRFSVGVPVFDPEGEDADDFFKWMIANFTQSQIELTEAEVELIKTKTRAPGHEFSAGDYKGFMDEYITRRNFFRNKSNRAINLGDFAKSWKPKAVKLGKARELQIYLAALYCSWPDKLLPQRFYKEDGTLMDTSELEMKIRELKLGIAFED